MCSSDLQLRGAAQSWWESYLATHADPEAITWEEFSESFRRYHVPEGLMIVKKEEFLALRQGPLSVSEYRDKFLQLSRYAPEDVNTDAKRQYRFMRGLVDPYCTHPHRTDCRYYTANGSNMCCAVRSRWIFQNLLPHSSEMCIRDSCNAKNQCANTLVRISFTNPVS